MNGRIYDPTLARFLSADPTVQSPGNPQTLNRYAYANNNPLTYTDPSGYGWFSKLWKSIIRPIIAIVAAAYLGAFTYFYLASGAFGAAFGAVASGIIGGAVGGFAGGIIGSGGNLQAGLYGAMTGAIFGGIGAYADGMQAAGNPGWADGQINRVLAHAAGGGLSSRLQGQKFGPGALAAGFSETFSPGISKKFNAAGQVGVMERTVASAVVGGTASVLGGGRFANGARTAAFARLFNEEMTESEKQAAADAVARANANGAAMEAAFGPGYNTDPPATRGRAAIGLGLVAAATGGAGLVFDGIELGAVTYTALGGALLLAPSKDTLTDLGLAVTTDGVGLLLGHTVKSTLNAYGYIISGGGMASLPSNDQP